jgi:serine/threonine protein kinase/Flp pilus assembly protein TadD
MAGGQARCLPADAGSAGGLAEVLAERLAEEMADAWRGGTPVPAEQFLVTHPELARHPPAVYRLIYEELCLREESGQKVSSAEIVRRFPQVRGQVEDFLCYYRLLHPGRADPGFPGVGETLGEFRLLAELGRGAVGCVYLATQPALADRPVVLKVTPRAGREHLSLARLQHTHIVPLYWCQDFPARDLRALCLPYLGGATLAELLAALCPCPPDRRTGRLLRDALDRAGDRAGVRLAASGPARAFLDRASYPQALTWIATCLADALQYAHDRGLVHLDLKPSNVLLASDGQPLVLDFHLARQPLQPDGPAPEWLGGTPSYMSPEQKAALLAVAEGLPLPAPVDGRSDIYSLGLLLYEALGGIVPLAPGTPPARLDRCNCRVSTGLADIIHKCLAPQPGDRYQEATELAADLRRHQTHQPLRGVGNRSWLERWRKWRRRRPHALTILGMLGTVFAVVLLALALGFGDLRRQLREAEAALADGQRQMKQGRYAEAVQSFRRGLASAEPLPGQEELRQTLAGRLRRAERAEAAQRLRALADRLRFCFGAENQAGRDLRSLEASCRRAWQEWASAARPGAATLDPEVERRLRVDLLDLAVLWADLLVQQAGRREVRQARHEALKVLAQAESLSGPSVVLYRERQAHAEALGLKRLAREAARQAARVAPRTAWEHYALGRSRLRRGDLAGAAARFERALETDPQEFWPNFYAGLCAYRLGRYADAVSAFHACVVLAPRRAECVYNRALAYARLARNDRALRDYSRALRLDPRLVSALLNRGMLHYQERRYPEAAADLRRALACGADPAQVHYHLALVHLARKDRAAARASLRQALLHNPFSRDARDLLDRLQKQVPGSRVKRGGNAAASGK